MTILLCAVPSHSFSQNEPWWGPDVRVLADVDGYVFAWSPDGQRFAFANDGGIVILDGPDFAGPGQTELPGWTGSAPISDLGWSPNGDALLFVSPWSPGEWTTIWRAETGGSGTDLLPDETADDIGSPGVRTLWLIDWLDTRELVFGKHCGTQCTEVFKVDVTTARYERLCAASVNGGLRWSPSRDRAIYPGHNGALGTAGAEGFSEITATPSSDGSCIDALPGCRGAAPGHWFAFEDWSRDGRQALLTRQTCDQGAIVDPRTAQLFLWDAGIGDFVSSDALSQGALASWSPDGSLIAFLRSRHPSDDTASDFDAELAIVDMTTGGTIRTLAALGPIASNQAADWGLYRPVWSPDSRRLVFRDGRDNLHVIGRDGTGLRSIVRETPSVASWSPDSRRLAIRVSRQANLWLGIERPYIVEL